MSKLACTNCGELDTVKEVDSVITRIWDGECYQQTYTEPGSLVCPNCGEELEE